MSIQQLVAPEKSQIQTVHFLDSFFNPKSIAFFGGNGNFIQNIASQQLINLYENNFKGKIYPIHPKLDTVFGTKAYKSVLDLPETPDLAMVVVNKTIVPTIFKELHQKGTHNVILVTAGFREAGDRSAEDNLKKIAKEYDIRFFGPNCIGLLNTHCVYGEDPSKTCILNCTSITYHGADSLSEKDSRPGNVSIISQSGTFASQVFFSGEEKCLNFSKSLSIGNEANIDMVDCMEYLENDPTTDVIMIYIEEIKRGRKFLEVARRITRKKPILVFYVGGTAAGAKAVASHTGSLAGNDNVYNGMFKQAGIIRTYSLDEFLGCALLFGAYAPYNIIPKGRRLVITTTSGGPGASMSDRACRLGLDLPQFTPETAEKIKKNLVDIANCSNPLDYTFNLNADVFYQKVPKILFTSGEFDAIITYGAFGPKYFYYQTIGKKFMESPENQRNLEMYFQIMYAAIDGAKRLIHKSQIPVIYVNPLGIKDEIYCYLNRQGIPTYQLEHEAVNALLRFIEYGEYLRKTSALPN